MNNIVWCISTGVLIFLVGFNLGGVVYCSIHNNPTKYVRSALLISIILLVINFILKGLTMVL